MAGVWVNPAHGTEAGRRALRQAAQEAESSVFRRAKPKPTLVPKRKTYDLSKKLLLRKPKVPSPTLRYGVARQGRVGVEYEHQGVKGWGPDETAARASWEQNRAMSKRDDWEVPMDHFMPATPRTRPNYRDGSGNVVGKRMTGAVTGVAKPKKVQPTRTAPRTAAAAMPDFTKPPIPPHLIGKRDRRYNPEHGRQRRLGVAAAGAGIGGGLAIHSGVRDVRAETRHVRGINPDVIKVPAEPRKPPSQKREGGKFRSLTDEERQSHQRRYERELGHHRTMSETRSGLEAARNAAERGAIVSRRSAGKLGVGAGLLAASAGIGRYGRSRSNREWR